MLPSYYTQPVYKNQVFFRIFFFVNFQLTACSQKAYNMADFNRARLKTPVILLEQLFQTPDTQREAVFLQQQRIKTIRRALVSTLPVFAGYLGLGFGFGVILRTRGYPV